MGREIQVSDEAATRGRSLGLYGDTRKRIARMARRAAPYTGPNGENRRFHDFVLTLNGQNVVWVDRAPVAA